MHVSVYLVVCLCWFLYWCFFVFVCFSIASCAGVLSGNICAEEL